MRHSNGDFGKTSSLDPQKGAPGQRSWFSAGVDPAPSLLGNILVGTTEVEA